METSGQGRACARTCLRWILRELRSMGLSSLSFLEASLWHQWASLLLPRQRSFQTPEQSGLCSAKGSSLKKRGSCEL